MIIWYMKRKNACNEKKDLMTLTLLHQIGLETPSLSVLECFLNPLWRSMEETTATFLFQKPVTDV